MAATRAMPAAAAVPVSSAVGYAQNTGIADRKPTVEIVIAIVSVTGDWAYAVSAQPIAPNRIITIR